MPRGINQFDEDRLDGLNVGDANSSNIVSPGIVTDGLVLHLDAGNYQSYPIAGTSWYDLSGHRNNGTLTNGPTYARDGGGAISFDGVDDYVETNYKLSNAAASISVWFKAPIQTTTLGSSLRPIVMHGDSAPALTPEAIEIIMWKGDHPDAGKIRFAWGNATDAAYYFNSSNRYDDDMWYLATISNNGTTFDGYINQNLLSTKLTYTSVSNATNLQIGGSTTVSARKFLGKIGDVLVYNRALTPTEVAQNFNALRARFNI